MRGVDCQQYVEARNVAFGIFLRKNDVARPQMIASQIAHHVAVGVIPEFAATDGVSVVCGIAGVRSGGRYLVDI